MRFSPEQHLKMARRLDERAQRECDPMKSKRLKGLALAHCLLAKQIAKASKPPTVAKTSRVLSGLIDGPTPFDTLETWEQHLTELKSLDPSMQRDEEIKRAQEMIDRKKRD